MVDDGELHAAHRIGLENSQLEPARVRQPDGRPRRAQDLLDATGNERETLATALEELTERITEHLAAEEEHIFPLAAAHMTPAEWQRLGEEGIGGLPKKQLPLGFGMVMYQADPEVIRGMLSHAPLVPRLLMPHLAPRAYARYARCLHGTTTP